MDMPANWQQAIASIDVAKVEQAVADYGPALQVVRDTWDKETLAEIADGKLFVSDEMMNDAIAKSIADAGDAAPVKGLTLQSLASGRLKVTADTRKVGPVELTGTIEDFVHDGDTSYMKFRVREKNIPQHGLMSWVFSRISLSMAERMVGHLDMPENLPVKIKGNTLLVDYSGVLAASRFGQTEVRGHRLLDMVEIKSATPKEGGILFETRLHVPDDVKYALLSIVKSSS